MPVPKYKIYTYENPFTLTHASFWEEIRSAPHLCVSQTLVEGLKAKYKRGSFDVITTVEAFLESFYSSWVVEPETRIKQYVSLSEAIAEIADLKLRRSMKRNQRSVLEALRFLMELGELPLDGLNTTLSEEESELFRLYQTLKDRSEWTPPRVESIDGSGQPISRLYEALKEITEEEYKKAYEDAQDASVLKYIREVIGKCSSKATEAPERIVFHGMHQFNPIYFILFEQLAKLGIEIVFLINEVPEFTNMYQTWRTVYEWTEVPFQPDRSPEARSYKANLVGCAIGQIVQGEFANVELNVRKYRNLTAFADEISHQYRDAKEKAKDRKDVLRNMSGQYYAPDNSDLNRLLRAYHPEQFGERHFLAYPIGQFILGMYNLWDPEAGCMKAETAMLKECLSVNFFRQEGMSVPIEIWHKIEPYLANVSTLDEAMRRISELKLKVNMIHLSEPSSTMHDLTGFSHFHVRSEELDYVAKCLRTLQSIATELFKTSVTSTTIDYRRHYKDLLHKIDYLLTGHPFVSEEEKTLVVEIKSKFEKLSDLNIQGSVEDLKETIHFYLAQSRHTDSSRWIARNFQQLDGGVLLAQAKQGNAHVYHLCLLSDQQMKVKLRDLLPWPLSEAFFAKSRYIADRVSHVIRSKEEYGNFLRYSLFYAAYYLENKIEFSYVEGRTGEEGEKATPYFLLDLIGGVVKEAQNTLSDVVSMRMSKEVGTLFNHDSTVLELQKFSVCSYRYLLEEWVQGSSYFHNDYHSRLYFRAVVLKQAWQALQGRPSSEALGKVKEIITHYQNAGYFPQWKDTDYHDLQSWVLKDLSIQDNNGVIEEFSSSYISMRLNFLYAMLTESRSAEDKVNLLRSIHDIQHKPAVNGQYRIAVKQFWEDGDVPPLRKKVSSTICSYCSMQEICLEGYKESDSD